ncbi:MAG TPA: DoxX family protein [Propionibacteriaceae bacterium]|nr:DoxX family protein [Propionibacteriaceae bacterium]
MNVFLAVVRDIGLLVARLTLGAVLVVHGWHRFTTGIAPTVAVLTDAALPEPQLFAWGATILEVVGGALLVFGLLTPIVAAFVVAEQVMVIVWLRWHNGIWNINNGIEYPVVLAVLAFVLVVFGSGRTGVDALFWRGRKTATPRSYVGTSA